MSILTLVALTAVNLGFGQTSLREIGLEYGPYSVGFANYTVYDSTRTYEKVYKYSNDFTARPISVSLWYPAKENSSGIEPLTVLNYFQILKDEEEWEHLPDEQLLNWFYYSNTPANQRHLKEKTQAYPNLDSAEGSFPVILYAPSYQASSVENFALCEVLASHGYVVISSPSRGTETRWFGKDNRKEMETQARDIEFLILEAANLPGVNLDQMALMGFSFGGLSNVLVQMRNRRIKALLSLDGTERYREDLLDASPFFDADRLNVPYLHMAQKDIPDSVLKADTIDPELNTKFILFDRITNSEATSLKFSHLTHSYFSSFGVLFANRDSRQDKSDREIMASYRWVTLYVKRFMDAYLKKDPEALKFLKREPEENQIPSELITRKSKEAQKKGMSYRDFIDLAAAQEYKDLSGLYTRCKREQPELEIPENVLNSLGLQLVFNPETSAKGIAILEFATTLYPNSANLFDSLAEAYLFDGNIDMARENFIKSLDRNPGNQNAIQRLGELGG